MSIRIDTILKFLKEIILRLKGDQIPFSEIFQRFRNILHLNNTAMELIADMGGKLGGEYVFDKKYLQDCIGKLSDLIRKSAYDLNFITENKYLELYEVIENMSKELETELSGKIVTRGIEKIYRFPEIEEGMEDFVGNKAYNLSRITRIPKIRIPEGFVVTLKGFRDYLAYNDLFKRIEKLLEDLQNNERTADSVSDAIRLMVHAGEIPPDLRRQIQGAIRSIPECDSGKCYFSVRSSAVGEDGDFSFAGLHDSFLNVPPGEIFSNYKKVLASLYNRSSLEYRLRMKLLSLEMAMPVLYQKMVDASVSGVLHTIDSNNPGSHECIVSGSWGLGKAVVEGGIVPDTFRVSRTPPYRIVDKEIAEKSFMLSPFEKGPLREVPDELKKKPCLTRELIEMIVGTGLTLEKFFKRPLEIEWSIDKKGELWILQARQLRIRHGKSLRRSDIKDILEKHKILLKGKGKIAYRGIGSGQVVFIEKDKDLDDFPRGGVIVSRYAPPWLAAIIPLASAVITDVGSVTGHMATVAREFRVPSIVGAQIATQVFKQGQKVTVDAERNIVYEGRIPELEYKQLLDEPPFEMTQEFQLLRRLIKRVAPLSLTDPESHTFTPANCKTLHDVMRFIHEKAFQTLVKIGKHPSFFLRRGGKQLKSDLPLDLVIIDLGGGISGSPGKETFITPDKIVSAPMRALWEGLSAPGVWSTEPVPVDFKGIMSSLTRTKSAEVLGNALPCVNLAVISSDYMNLSLPIGYHFTAIEASMGNSSEKNHIFFRFVGGVTDLTRRSRRAQLLMRILENGGFKVEVNGDLVIARAINLTETQMKDQLVLLGKLIGFTRQMDILMKNENDIERYYNLFLKREEMSA